MVLLREVKVIPKAVLPEADRMGWLAPVIELQAMQGV